VGWYGSGFYPAFYIQLISGAFLGAIYPVMSRLFKESPEMLAKLYQKSFQLMFLFALPVSVGGYLVADKIIPFFYWQGYLNSIIVFKILISGTVFFCLNSLFGHLLVSINRQAVAMRIAGLALGVNLILSFSLVGKFSHIGVSISFVISGIAGTIASLSYLHRNLYRLRLLKPLAKATLANLVMAVALVLFKGMNVLFLILLGSVIYGIVLFSTRYFGREDIVLFREFLRNMGEKRGAA
jgi:O-antigen/teichoic acid export membrane protein